MTDPKRIRTAIAEARAFVKAAELALRNGRELGGTFYIHTGKASGAMRRRSLDLTRALAEMRKP